MTFILGKTKPRAWTALNFSDYLLLVVLAVCTVFFFLKLFSITQRTLDFSSIVPYIITKNSQGAYESGILLQGLYTTLRLGFWSMIVALILGSLIGIFSAHKKGFAALPFRFFIQIIRNTPPLILLFLVFFFASYILTEPILQFEFLLSKSPHGVQSAFYTLVAPKGQLDIMIAAIITLGIYEGAYVAEIVRGGMESIPKAQWEAARSQGLTLWQARRLIILPQTFRMSLPPLVGQAISTFKDSALASIISLADLTFQSTEVMTVSNITFELWVVVALFYFAISFCLEQIGWRLEKRVKWYH